MTLLQQITKTLLLIPYEQFYVQSHYYHKELIPEQNTGENNPMYQLTFDPILRHQLQYTPISTPTLPLPRPYYGSHPTTCQTTYIKGTYNILDTFMRHDIAYCIF